MSLEKEFVPYQESLELKELKFDEPCMAFFNGKHHDWLIDNNNDLDYPTINPSKNIGKCIKRPTFSQAFRFFREKYKLHSSINLGVSDEQDRSGLEYDEYIFVIEGVNGCDYDNYNTPKFSKSPEEAELACLKKLIEIVKNDTRRNIRI